MATAIPYNGSPDNAFPPAPAGWCACLWEDELARDYSRRKLEELPLWHFCDELTPCGLYRFFHYETPIGTAVGALRYEGQGTMGQRSGPHPHHHGEQPSHHGMHGYMGQQNISDGGDPTQSGGQPAAGGGDQGGPGNAGGSGGALNEGNGGQGGGGGGGGGQTTNEPIPSADNTCGAWVPDASNAQAAAIARTISFNNSPVPWADQGHYDATLNGTAWRFVMYWENGLKNVASFRCTQPVSGGATKAGFGWGAALLAALIAAGGIAAAVFGTKTHAH